MQVISKDASKMNKFLQKLYEDKPLYIPYNMKKQFPKAVATAITKQNQLIKETWVLVLIGIPRELMCELETTILHSKGVTGILSTNRTDTTG